MENEIDKLKKEIDSLINTLGKDHIDLIPKYNFLANEYLQKDNLDQAIKYYEEVLAIQLKTFGEEHADTATSYDNIGLVYHDKGDIAHALTNYEKALEIRLKLFGGEHPDIAASYNNIACVYYHKCDYERALSYYDKSLSMQLKILGADHSYNATNYNNMAYCYSQMGDYENAIECCKKLLQIQNTTLCEDNHDLLDTNMKLGYLYNKKCDFEIALSFYKIALEKGIESISEEHLESASNFLNIGNDFEKKGFYDKSNDFKKIGKMLFDKFFNIHQDRMIFIDLDIKNAYCEKSELFEELINNHKEKIEGITNKHGRFHPDAITEYNHLGYLYYRNCELDNAIDSYKRSIEIFSQTKGEYSQDIADAYTGIANSYYKKNEYNIALKYYGKSLVISKSFNDYSEIAYRYYDLGDSYHSIGNYVEAISHYEKSLEIRLEIYSENHYETAKSYDSIGIAYYSNGEFNKAIDLHKKALAIFMKVIGYNHPRTALTYNNIGDCFVKIGDYERAIIFFTRALEIQLDNCDGDNPVLANTYDRLGVAYSYKGDINISLDYFIKALEIRIHKLGENHIDTAFSFINTYSLDPLNENDNNNSIIYQEKALEIFMKYYGDRHPFTASALEHIGKLYYINGNYNLAINYYEKALQIRIMSLGEENCDTAISYYSTGLCYFRINNYGLAIHNLEKSISIIKKNQFLELSPFILLGRYFIINNKNTIAKITFYEGISLLENWLKNNPSTKTFTFSKNIYIFYFYIYANAKLNDLPSVFNAAEQIRARGFLERISIKTAAYASGISENDSLYLLQLTDEIEKLMLKRSREIEKTLEIKNARVLIDISDQLDKKENERDALYSRLLENDQFKNLIDPGYINLEEAQKCCGEKRAILEYIIWEGKEDDRQSYCLIIKQEDVSLEKIEWGEPCEEAARNFRPDDFEYKFINLQETASLLFSHLFKPLEKYLIGIDELVISPDGPLAFIPFDLLKSPEGDYLCEKYSISMIPSVSVMKMINERISPEKRKAFLGIGDVIYRLDDQVKKDTDDKRSQTLSKKATEYYTSRAGFDDLWGYRKATNQQMSNLPKSSEELHSIAKNIFSMSGADLLLREKASEREVKTLSASGELSKYEIVHFACHGKFDEQIPQNSALILAEYMDSYKNNDDSLETEEQPEYDGYLDVNDVALLNLGADIVTLSACETGLGSIVRGDGIVGLTRAFMVAGAKNVASTLWCINDESTKEFMISMYKKVKEKKQTYKEAFRNTKLEFIKSDRYNYPYYWAGFILWGV